MFQWFRPKNHAHPPAGDETGVDDGWYTPESADRLLSIPRRRKLLEQIWGQTSLSHSQFDRLYYQPLASYAELVQHFPASESHHHAWPGGMLDHALECVMYSLKLRQSHLLPPGEAPETQAAQAEAWSAAIACGALLHDIGKIAVDLCIEQRDGQFWHPWRGPLRQPYRFRYRPDREYRLHNAAVGLLYTQILPPDILDWLSEFPELWASLLYILAGQYEHAGLAGEIVLQADRASVSHSLGGDPARTLTQPGHSLQRSLLDGLRFLVKEQFRLNQAQASDGWLTDETLWLVSKTAADKLRAYLLSLGTAGIPSQNPALFNILQEHGIVQATADNKAIWRATVTADNDWSYTFTLLKVAPSLIWLTEEQRPPSFPGTVRCIIEENVAADAASQTESAVSVEDVPSQAAAVPSDATDALLSLLQIQSPAPESAPSSTVPLTTTPVHADEEPQSPSAEHFICWLRQGIAARKLIVNDANALVHTVAGTVFLVTPGIFQRYALEHPQTAIAAKKKALQDWVWVQKQFERLKLHLKQPVDNRNVWCCHVAGPRKAHKLYGYVLKSYDVVMTQQLPDNPYLTLSCPMVKQD
ncbi:TPA: helicase/relaxase domain-containing protein [Klebsiella quasipneumoniae subsp. quasipneumoniae]|nr:helicase/relaxase domain-containing protein [Klebsiella quasipneumoniae subsp. quasipneumoniae]